MTLENNDLNTASFIPCPPATVAPLDNAGWHPIESGWLEELAVEMQGIARQAQQLLIKNRRTGKQITDALAQIKAWRETHRQLESESAPEVVLDENLGSRLEPDAFIAFILAQESSLSLTPGEFAALALLQEISGRVELDVVARKHAFSLAAQHITLKIGKLHAATTLLSLRDANPELRDAIQVILPVLLNDRPAQA